MEKKSERLEVRLGYQEKQTFTEACDSQGDTPSGAIRRFIKGYVRRSDSDIMSSAIRSATKRRLPKYAMIAAVVGISIAGVWSVYSHFNQPSDAEIFSARDKNGDGELEFTEHGIPPGRDNGPSGVMRVLDLDASGTISRAEFVREGRMVYALMNMDSSDSETEDSEGMTLVEFKFDKLTSTSGIYVGAKINAKGLDRLVIWPAQGLPTVAEGSVAIAMGLENELEVQADTIVTHK